MPSASSKFTDSIFASRPHQILIGLLLAASLIPIWSVTFFPSQNGPWHVLVSKMLNDYIAGPSFNYFEYYELTPRVIPHLLHTLLVTLLHFALPILIAHKVALSVYVVSFPLSVFAFLSALDPRRAVYGYASFLFVYNLPVLRGYHDFALGIPVVLFTMAYWLRTRDRVTVTRNAAVTGLILLAYISHFFNFLMLGLFVLMFTLYERRSIRQLTLALLPFVPASLLMVDFARFMLTRPAWMSRSDFEMFAPHQAADHFLRFGYTVSPAAAVMTFVPLAFVGWGIARTVRDGYAEFRGFHTLKDGLLFLMLGVLGVAYLLMPHKFFGWHFANTRFIPFVLVAAFACATPHLGRLGARTFVGATTAAALAMYALLTPHLVAADRKIGEYVSGLEQFRTGGLLYPIDFRADNFGTIQPLTRAHEYYHVFRGGANGRGIAMYSSLTPIPYRVYPVVRAFPVWRPDDSDRRAATLAGRYDHVISWGTNDEFAQSLNRARFRLVHQQGHLYFYANDSRRDSKLSTLAGALR